MREHFSELCFLPKQRLVLERDVETTIILGAYSSGKSTAGALALLREIALNPWRPEYGASRPRSMIIGTSLGTIRNSTYKALMGLVPEEMIIRERGYPTPTIQWVNGHETVLYGMRGRWDGQSLCALLLDEAHTLAPIVDRWEDLMSRVRGPTGRRKRWIICGLPEEGFLRAKVGLPHHYANPNFLHVHMSIAENTHLGAETRRRIESDVGASDAHVFLSGEWRKPVDAVAPEYDAAKHVVLNPGDKTRPVVLAADVGSQACCLVGQVTRIMAGDPPVEVDRTLHIVDEVITDDTTTETLIGKVLAKGWKLDPSSSIVLDPRSHLDVIEAARRAAPKGTKILRYTQGQAQYDIGYGLRCLRRGLLDAHGKVRLTFSSSLPMSRRSILVALPAMKYGPSGRPHKDNARDHAVDALRLLCVTHLPIREGGGAKVEAVHSSWG